MRRFLPFLFSLCVLHASAQLVITNHVILQTAADSWGVGSFAQRQTFVLFSRYINGYPQFVVSPRNPSRSGADNEEMKTNRVQRIMNPEWAVALGVTNVYTFWYVSGNNYDGNASVRSNLNVTTFGQLIQAPTNSYNRFGLLTNDGTFTSAAQKFRSVVIGDIPYWPFPSGVPSIGARDYSYGGRTVALANSMPYVDTYVNTSNAVNAAYQLNTNGYWFSTDANATNNHPGNEISGVLGMTTVYALGEETNIFTCVIDVGSPGSPSTNHCTYTSVSYNGGILSGIFRAARMGSSYYHVTATQTNDMTGMFPLMPALTNYQCEIFRVTSLPAGMFSLVEDGVVIGHFSNAKFASGINLFSDVHSGAMQNQKDMTLALLCDYANVNRTNASDTLPGNSLWTNLGSICSTIWSTNNFGVDHYVAEPLIVSANNSLFAKDQILNANVQQTNHIFAVVPDTTWAIGTLNVLK